MAKVNSRQKGARGERELAHFLTAHGYPARRGQQFSGSPDSPDVVCKSLSRFQIECKLVEALNIHKAIAQARGDCGPDQTPVVMHKKNHTEWLCTLPLEDFMEILWYHPDFKPEWEKETKKYEEKCPQCNSTDVKQKPKFDGYTEDIWQCNFCTTFWAVE